MGQHRELKGMGLAIVWDGGSEVLVRDGDRVIERHRTEPLQPRLAGRLINRIESDLMFAALAMEAQS